MCRGLIFSVSLILLGALTGNVWPSAKASNPSPADGASCVDPDVVLSWSPGIYAVSHDVYLGTVFDDVNDANVMSPEYIGRQDPNSYAPGTLNWETIYYWRIDEVNENDPNIWKGDVWSFGTACENGLLNDFTPIGISLIPKGNLVYDAIPILGFKVFCTSIPTFACDIIVDGNIYPCQAFSDCWKRKNIECPSSCTGFCRVSGVNGYCKQDLFTRVCSCITSSDSSSSSSSSPTPLDATALFMAKNLIALPGSQLEIVFDPNNLIPEYDENNNHFQTILVDYFESYQTDANLQADWNNIGGGQAHLWTEVYDANMHSMKFDYNNAAAPYYSEVVRVYDSPQDWTWDTLNTLEFWVRGEANNNAQQMYVVVKDANEHTAVVEYNGDQNDVKCEEWWPVRIAFQEFIDEGVNMTNVKELSIGFGDRVTPIPGWSGTVYVDNIGLYPTRCLYRPSGDLNNDCVVNFVDFAIMAKSWLETGIFP